VLAGGEASNRGERGTLTKYQLLMAFDPALPQTHAPIVSAELRGQFNERKDTTGRRV
jgi:hypothetical protein